MNNQIILASASPQRKTLLEGLGLSFDVIPSGVNERDCPEKDPRKRAKDLAVLKARDVRKKQENAWIIGCDTLVVAEDGTVLEKPVDESDARRMLELLSGKVCAVHSGLAVIDPAGKEYADVSSSFVGFKELSSKEKDWWISTGQWKDRSGSFQIDGLGQLMIAKLEGDWSSVVGLPVFLLGELFRQARAPFFGGNER